MTAQQQLDSLLTSIEALRTHHQRQHDVLRAEAQKPRRTEEDRALMAAYALAHRAVVAQLSEMLRKHRAEVAAS